MIVTKDLLDTIPSGEALSRLCIHDTLDAPLHVMVLVLKPKANYPMHYHKKTAEFYWVLEGELEITLMKEDGSANQICLSPSKDPGFLMDAGINHAVQNQSENLSCRFLEIRPGPFDPSDNVVFAE